MYVRERFDISVMTGVTQSTKHNPADATSVIIGALGAAMIGAILTNILPMYLGILSDTKALNNQQTGMLASAFFLGFNISGLSAFAWVRRVHWRNVCLYALPVGIAAFFWSARSDAYSALMAATVLAGASLGVLYTTGTVVIGDTTNSARWYGIKMAVEAAGGIVLIYLLPITLIPKFGFTGIVIGISAYSLVLLPALLLLPNCWGKSEAESANSAQSEVAPVTDRLAVGITIFALFIFCVGNAAIWAFAERLGTLAGFSVSSVGVLLAATLASGVAGALGVAVVGNRLGSARCFIVVALVGIVGLVCLNVQGAFLVFALGNCLCSASWVAGTSFAMGETSHLDHDGRYVALIVPAIGFGSMVGPAITGWLMTIGSTSLALTFSGVTIMASIGLMLFARARTVSARIAEPLAKA